MLRAVASSLISPSCEPAMLLSSNIFLMQSRGRRRTLTPAPWIPPVFEKKSHLISEENRKLLKDLDVAEKQSISISEVKESSSNVIADIPQSTRRVGLLVRKIGMMPQWTNTGERLLCTLLEVAENNVVNVTTPEEWYRKSIVGKRKAFNRDGPMHKVTVGAVNGEAYKFTRAYRQQFKRAGVNVKRHLGSFLVTPDALPEVGSVLDARHFMTGQNVTVSGKSIDWGFQGGMHRWGMRGQPFRRTTKSHRRIGSVGSVGDARIWPGKRMPGHMGYEWVTVSGLQIIRMNSEKQVIYVKGSVPGDVGDILQLKDCLQQEKKISTAPLPTWSPSLTTIPEDDESEASTKEAFVPNIFRFTSPTIAFTDADAKKAAGRDKTKAKIAKVKK